MNCSASRRVFAFSCAKASLLGKFAAWLSAVGRPALLLTAAHAPLSPIASAVASSPSSASVSSIGANSCP